MAIIPMFLNQMSKDGSLADLPTNVKIMNINTIRVMLSPPSFRAGNLASSTKRQNKAINILIEVL